VETVRKYSAEAGIKMPEVGIFDTPEVNAFATGMSKEQFAGRGLQRPAAQMTRARSRSGHRPRSRPRANGDMVTLALIQGVVNTFVMFLSRVIGHTVDRVVFKTENGHGPAFFVTMIVAELVLGVLASIIVMWFSRQREFRADRGGASLAGRQAHDRRAGTAERAASRSPCRTRWRPSASAAAARAASSACS
jgi:heat shock protein HtpX